MFFGLRREDEMTRYCTGVVLTLLLSGDALAARRAEVAVVGVHVDSVDDASAVEVSSRLSEALEATGRIDAVSPGKVRGRISGREALVVEGIFLGPGRANLAEGRVLYERADFETAIPVLQSAADELSDGMAGATDSKDLIDALLLLGLAHASVGDTGQAREIFRRVVTLEPSRQLDSVNYPPKFVAMFDAVRDEVRGQAPAALVVQSNDVEAQVYIDGRDVGKAPVTVSDLPPGAHTVLVTGKGGKRAFTREELASGERKVFQAGNLDTRSLGEPGESASERSRQTRQLYTSLGAHAATGLIVLGGQVSNDQVALQLYEPRTGNFSQALSAPAGSDPITAMVDLVPSAATWLTDDGTLRADRVSTSVVSLNVDTNALLSSILLDPEPIVEVVTVTKGLPWYAWAGIATVAAGGAATAAVLLVAEDPIDPNQGTIIVGPIP